MTNELYRKLVDLYAGRELPAELEAEMEAAAASDVALKQDMATLRETVDAVHALPSPEFTEESYQRVLMNVYSKGIAMQPVTPTPNYLQYQLPIQG